MSLILITAADAKYFDLVQGTLLSIREKPQSQGVGIGFLDLGCTPEQQAWLQQQVDSIQRPDWEFDFPGRETAPEHLKGLLVRPFLRRYFPGFDTYLWLDADAWVQDWAAIDLLIKGAQRRGMAIVPELDRHSPHLYGGWPEVQNYAYQHYQAVFGEEVAQQLYTYPVLNAGVFALHTQAPHWEVWAMCLNQGLQRCASIMTTQTALNLAIYGYGLFDQTEILPAWCNWTRHCCGLPVWDPQRHCLVEPYLPNTPIGILHLTGDQAERAMAPTTDGTEIEVWLRYRSPQEQSAIKPDEAVPVTNLDQRGLPNTLKLREINLILFPDWQQPEAQLLPAIASILEPLLSYPDNNRITLLIDCQQIDRETADLAISSVIMELLYEEHLEVSELPEITLLDALDRHQWQTLRLQLHSRLVIPYENFAAVQAAGLETLPPLDLSGVQQLITLQQEAIKLRDRGQLTEAAQTLQVILQQQESAEVWFELGIIYRQMERYEEGLQALTRALELAPETAAYHDHSGMMLEELADIPAAAQAYQQAIALDPTYINAYTHLGNLVAQHGDPEQAVRIYQQAIATNPQFLGSYLNLGNVLLELGDVEPAIAAYEAALELEPAHADVLHNLELAQELAQNSMQIHRFAGDRLYSRNRYAEAAEHFQALLTDPAIEVAVYLGLADCYEHLQQYDAVITVCQQGIVAHPLSLPLQNQLIRALRESNQTVAAIAQATQSAQQFPDQVFLRLQQHLLLPVLYQSLEEIQQYRQRFQQGLTTLIQETPLTTPKDYRSALEAINQHTNFLLAYQHQNDVELQQQYGAWVAQIMTANYPQWSHPRSLPTTGDRIRIGYVSACMWEHTVGKLMIGWFQHHDATRFQIHSYHLSATNDSLTQQFRQSSDVFHQLPQNLEAIAPQILADQLDVLVFPDIGQYPLSTQLAALRLAPVQCATWVHPVTSGLPTVDYFLSSDLMEPEHAEAHYSEHLIRLPNLGISVAPPTIAPPTKCRADFQLREDAIVYLCCQLLCKCAPYQDAVLAAIAQQVPKAQFVFIARPNALVADQFQQRLQRAFAAVGLESTAHCVMLPPQSQTDYWSLNQLSDVFLDSFGWSGGHTTLEAIACDLPVVTYPGEFMRGRHSAAILTLLGVTETIAQTEAEYVALAVRLGNDPLWRQQVIQQMRDRQPNLYNDTACIEALETFYSQVGKRSQ